MTNPYLTSWGHYPNSPQTFSAMTWPSDVEHALNDCRKHQTTTLPFGHGRSYGDSCLAQSNHVLYTRPMDRWIEANWQTGVIRAHAGLMLSEVLHRALPNGWFLPVTPGTQYVTLGGAVANDVHGKNHHQRGTFGCHIRRLGLLRSDRGYVECSSLQDATLFHTTIGGLGLTGVILWIEMQLHRINSNSIRQRCIRFEHIDEFFALSETYDHQHEYAVAWIDCLAKNTALGRGHYLFGDHVPEGDLKIITRPKLSVPLTPPISLVNTRTLRWFNAWYYHRVGDKEQITQIDYDTFFYPLDRILQWNRIYGRRGFQQYQCVIPEQHAKGTLQEILRIISSSGMGSFLAVLKRCGTIISPGLLSFPLPGVSLALDFPESGDRLASLFQRLDALVHEVGGRLYPAKDAHMQAEHFQRAYPRWRELEDLRDPLLMSKFWQRVTKQNGIKQ